MNLFNQHRVTNIIPFDGEADYHGLVFSKEESEHYFRNLFEKIPWKNDEAFIFGKHHIIKIIE